MPMEFLEAGNKQRAEDAAKAATTSKMTLRREMQSLKEVVASKALEARGGTG